MFVDDPLVVEVGKRDAFFVCSDCGEWVIVADHAFNALFLQDCSDRVDCSVHAPDCGQVALYCLDDSNSVVFLIESE